MEKEKEVLDANRNTPISSPDGRTGTQPLPQNRSSDQEHRKTCAPDRLSVPRAFKCTERYTSPTDQMMSPVSKGLLARSRKGVAQLVLPPTKNQPKIQDLHFQNVGVSQS